MEETHVVTCFLRNRGEVLLLRRSDAVGSYAGRWGAVAGHVEPDPGDDEHWEGNRADDADGGSPDAAAVDAATRREIDEETGLVDAVTRVRAGDPFPVADPDLGTRWVVHPHLFDCESRAVDPNEETTGTAWVHPTEIRRRETVPDLWRSYERVAPTVETVAGDREHGSAYLSVRALEVLRDRAGVLAFGSNGDAGTRDEGPPDGHGDSGPADAWTELVALARELLAARPAMTVVGNRVNQVVESARSERTAAAVERAARAGIERAVAADDAAAREAAALVSGARVFTVSRSGTVREALRLADPEAVVVAESRPGREGVGVAEAFAAERPVTLATDAAVPWVLADRPVDAVLVGADSVLPDGSVINKVGTRTAALAAAREGVPVYVVAARDKVRPAGPADGRGAGGTGEDGDGGDHDVDLETADPTELYDGPADLDLANPLFDVTDPDLLAGVVTGEGLRSPGEIADIAADHRDLAAWQDEEPDGVGDRKGSAE